MPNEALVVLNNQNALALGGLGLNSKLFQPKAAFLELVQKLSHAQNVTFGKLRDTTTNQHFDKMRVVFLQPPMERRRMYEKGKFTKDAVLCFSLDMITPHEKAKKPGAMQCAGCPMADWSTWKKTKNSNDVPPCLPYWHCYVVDRQTNMPYWLDVKGKSIDEFKTQMAQWSRVYQMLLSNVKAENKKIAGENSAIEAANAALPEGQPKQELKPLKPLPNVFDISFEVYVVAPVAGASNQNYTLGFRDFTVVPDDAKKEYGQMFMDFVNNQRSSTPETDEAEPSGDEVVAAPATAPTPTQAAPVVVLPPTGATSPAPATSDITI